MCRGASAIVDARLRGMTVVPDQVTEEGELRGDAVLGSTAEAGDHHIEAHQTSERVVDRRAV